MKQKNPTGVRFNEEKLAFVMAKEKLDSPQQVVNFFLDSYWWQNKLGEAPKSPATIIPPIPTAGPRQEPKIDQFEAYRADIVATTYSGDLQKVMKEINDHSELGAINKAKLRVIADNHRLNFTN